MERKSLTSNSNVSEVVPSDLQMEILLRLPPKSLARFTCVSKKWVSMIREKQFRNLYLLRSMARGPRVMLTCKASEGDVLVHSVYQEEEPLLSSGQREIRTPLGYAFHMSQSIRGLICLEGGGSKFALWNPAINKVMALPEIQAPRELAITASFFGYDEATDVYKVLSMRMFVYDRPFTGAKEHQVLTVGGSDHEESWRQIRCKHHHTPTTNGICKGGVLYYGAAYGRKEIDKYFVMSFNIRSEEFRVIALPEEIKFCHFWRLVSYHGEIALVDDSRQSGEVNMWVRSGVSGEWRKNFFEIPYKRKDVGDVLFSFRGTVGSGELVFTANVCCDKSIFVFYYDEVTERVRKFRMDGGAGGRRRFVQTFLDHVDSVFLM